MTPVTERDWYAWHDDYDDPGTALAYRFTGTPDPLEEGARMFTFRGHHPRTGPRRHLSLSAERSVVPAAAPFPACGGGCSAPYSPPGGDLRAHLAAGVTMIGSPVPAGDPPA